MDQRQAGRGQQSRRAALRALPTPVDVELYVQDAAPLLEVLGDLREPRIADLDALLREVDDLRGTMRRDLTLAATAVESGDDDLAGWLLLGENGTVRSFEERALAHLSDLEAREAALHETPDQVIPVPVTAPRRLRRMMPAAPLVAACAALFGFLTGAVPGMGSPPSSPSTSNVALDSYAELADLASRGASDHRITEAAMKFHRDLAPLVTAGTPDPAAIEKAIALLQSERAVIASGSDSPALLAVLRQADALVARLRASLPRKSTRPLIVVPAAPQQQRSAAPKSSPTPKASPAPAPSSSPVASPKPSTTSSTSPTPSSSPSNPLPSTPLKN